MEEGDINEESGITEDAATTEGVEKKAPAGDAKESDASDPFDNEEATAALGSLAGSGAEDTQASAQAGSRGQETVTIDNEIKAVDLTKSPEAKGESDGLDEPFESFDKADGGLEDPIASRGGNVEGNPFAQDKDAGAGAGTSESEAAANVSSTTPVTAVSGDETEPVKSSVVLVSGQTTDGSFSGALTDDELSAASDATAADTAANPSPAAGEGASSSNSEGAEATDELQTPSGDEMPADTTGTAPVVDAAASTSPTQDTAAQPAATGPASDTLPAPAVDPTPASPTTTSSSDPATLPPSTDATAPTPTPTPSTTSPFLGFNAGSSSDYQKPVAVYRGQGGHMGFGGHGGGGGYRARTPDGSTGSAADSGMPRQDPVGSYASSQQQQASKDPSLSLGSDAATSAASGDSWMPAGTMVDMKGSGSLMTTSWLFTIATLVTFFGGIAACMRKGRRPGTMAPTPASHLPGGAPAAFKEAADVQLPSGAREKSAPNAREKKSPLKMGLGASRAPKEAPLLPVTRPQTEPTEGWGDGWRSEEEDGWDIDGPGPNKARGRDIESGGAGSIGHRHAQHETGAGGWGTFEEPVVAPRTVKPPSIALTRPAPPPSDDGWGDEFEEEDDDFGSGPTNLSGSAAAVPPPAPSTNLKFPPGPPSGAVQLRGSDKVSPRGARSLVLKKTDKKA